jgi:HK97 family phage prohead protease
MPKKNETNQIERRTFVFKELRASDEGEDPKITGYAAVFNSLSEDLGGFRERITPGAFAKTIEEHDIRSLFNHDKNHVLGRNKAGTLILEEDEVGLRMEIHPPDTQVARDLLTSIRRGDIDQASFGFKTIRDDWEQVEEMVLRTLIEVKLYDVSPVTFPAYPQTTVSVREKLLEFDQRDNSVDPDETPDPEDAPGQEAHPSEDDPEEDPQVRTEILRRRLDLAERL